MSASQVSSAFTASLPALRKKVDALYFGNTILVNDVFTRLRRWAGGYGGDRPIGRYMLIGPTGTGKSRFAEALAIAIYNNPKMVIKVDGNTYADRSDMTRWIGSGPRWVGDEIIPICSDKYLNGYRRDGLPWIYRVDELGLGCRSLRDHHFAVLESGMVENAKNEKVLWNNSIVFMTSNEAQQEILDFVRDSPKPTGDLASVNPEKIEEKHRALFDRMLLAASERQESLNRLVESVLTRRYDPQFVNRFDMIVGFEPYDMNEAVQICRILSLNKLLFREIDAEISDEVVTWLTSRGFSEALGVRPIERVIEREIDGRIVDMLIDGRLKAGDRVKFLINELSELEILPDGRSPTTAVTVIPPLPDELALLFTRIDASQTLAEGVQRLLAAGALSARDKGLVLAAVGKLAGSMDQTSTQLLGIVAKHLGSPSR